MPIATTLLTRATATGTSLKVLGRAGIVRPYSPVALARVGKALKDWGTGPAGGFTALALLYAAAGRRSSTSSVS